MRACEAIYGPDQGDAIEELVVLSTGEPCPCRQGNPCPLLDEEGCNPLAERTPEATRQSANRALAAAIATAQRAYPSI